MNLAELSALGGNPVLSAAASAAIEQALGAGAVVNNQPGRVLASSTGLSVGILGTGTGLLPNFRVSLRALESKGKANTLSEPKILTLSNSIGLIEISDEISYIESVRNVANSTNQTTNEVTNETTTASNSVLAPEYKTERTGIRLRVLLSVARNSDIVTLGPFSQPSKVSVGLLMQVPCRPQPMMALDRLSWPNHNSATRQISDGASCEKW